MLWSVNKLARAVTKRTRACDRRLARLISCVHHTSTFRQYCHVGSTAQHCRLVFFFHDSDFAGELEDSKSTSGESYVFLEVEYSFPVSKLDVLETNVSIPQFYRIRNYFGRDAVQGWMGYLLLFIEYGDRSVTFLE